MSASARLPGEPTVCTGTPSCALVDSRYSVPVSASRPHDRAGVHYKTSAALINQYLNPSTRLDTGVTHCTWIACGDNGPDVLCPVRVDGEPGDSITARGASTGLAHSLAFSIHG